MKKIPNSNLSHHILFALSHKPASSITALAQDLESLRPSVSRTVNSLCEVGFIAREGRILYLTEAGKEEVERLSTELPTKVKKSTDLATRSLEQAIETWKRFEPRVNNKALEAAISQHQLNIEMGSHLPQIAAAIHSIQTPQIAALQAIRPFETSGALQAINSLELSRALQTIKGPELSGALQAMQSLKLSGALQAMKAQAMKALEMSATMKAVNSLAQIQSINLNWLHSWHEEITFGLNHLLIENNAFISGIMVDLEVIAKVSVVTNSAFSNLVYQTARIATAYEVYFKDIAKKFNQIPSLESLDLYVAIPTTATASLVGSVRTVIESQTSVPIEEKPTPLESTRVLVYSERYVEMTPMLERYLKPLGERFVNKWEGAWQTLYSESRDRYSQATHSGRELLMQVLAYLAPDEIFTREDCVKHKVEKPSRKMRIKYILGSNNNHTIELIDSMAETLDNMYHLLAGEAHRRDDKIRYDDTVAGQLAALGGLLITLLSQRNHNQF